MQTDKLADMPTNRPVNRLLYHLASGGCPGF
jgi:hypothetical protein